MAFTVQQTLGWVDAKGQQCRTKHYMTGNSYTDQATTLGNLQSAISAISNAANFSAPGVGGFPTHSGEYGTQATYGSVTDKAVMTFIDADGNIHRMTIPAPKAAIFLADGITVDTGNSDVSTYVTLITNDAAANHFVSTRGGKGFTSFAGGLRTKKPNQRKMSIFTLQGDLGGPAE